MTNAFARIVSIVSARDGARVQDVDGLVYVAEDGGDSDAGPGGEPGVGVTAPQMGEGEQSLALGGKAPPPRPDLPPPGGQLPGQEPQCAAGQIDRGRVDKHAKLLADMGDLGCEPVYQELRRCAGLSNSRSAPPAWKRLSHTILPLLIRQDYRAARVMGSRTYATS
ncbi:hypothetical protein GCM10010278_86950 [Streptomyces melanogenes]|nr:hypothetical protein GCM10010278_86950 [Streptomyces melanogenes]